MECYLMVRSKLPSGIRIARRHKYRFPIEITARCAHRVCGIARFFSRNDINDDHKHTKTTREITFSAFAALAVLRPQKKARRQEIVQTIESRIRRLNTITTRNYRCWVLLSIVLRVFGFAGCGGGLTVMSTWPRRFEGSLAATCQLTTHVNGLRARHDRKYVPEEVSSAFRSLFMARLTRRCA